MRWLDHLLARWNAERHFPSTTLDAIQRSIAASESQHLGEICFAVEGGLPFADVVRGQTARQRAHAAFERLRVWDTEHNTGVLVYVLVADHAIEIVADRGIAAKVDAAEWTAACALMQERFSVGDYERGAIAGVDAIGAILAREFPSRGERNPDELSDRPVLL